MGLCGPFRYLYRDYTRYILPYALNLNPQTLNTWWKTNRRVQLCSAGRPLPAQEAALLRCSNTAVAVCEEKDSAPILGVAGLRYRLSYVFRFRV